MLLQMIARSGPVSDSGRFVGNPDIWPTPPRYVRIAGYSPMSDPIIKSQDSGADVNREMVVVSSGEGPSRVALSRHHREKMKPIGQAQVDLGKSSIKSYRRDSRTQQIWECSSPSSLIAPASAPDTAFPLDAPAPLD
jgi:hypothetical protein